MLLTNLEEGMGMNKCIRANPDTKELYELFELTHQHLLLSVNAGSSEAITKSWTLDVSFPAYVAALTSFVGGFIRSVRGNQHGLKPIDSVTRFIQRPKKTIGKSEYDRSAQQIAIKTLEIHEKIKAVRNEERRKWSKSQDSETN